jgi:hypothetical protein
MLIPLVGLVVLVVLLVLLITSRYKVAGPNQAFIVTGRKGKAVLNPETGELSTDLSGQKVVLGGGVFVIPFVQKLATMDDWARTPPRDRGETSRARWPSETLASATWHSTEPSAGSSTSKVAPPSASVHRPPMNSRRWSDGRKSRPLMGPLSHWVQRHDRWAGVVLF